MIDRSDPRRADDSFVDAARHAAESCYVVYAGSDALLAPSLPIAPASVPECVVAKLGVDTADSVFLGLLDGVAWFAIDVAGLPEEARAPLLGFGRFVALGPIQDPIDGEAWSLLAQARALLAWNARTQYCSACGAPTEMRDAGYVRACPSPACGVLHFPRTDPAVIVRVTHEDRCLLARQPAYRPGLRSIVAGFVEPGESLEDAVRREVKEEVGLDLATLSYVGSQPWPFPTSLMVGFVAESVGDEIRVDGREIESAEWMTRDAVRRETQSGALVLASAKSIARRLIDDWLNADEDLGAAPPNQG
ncbi:MAG: NAD(+) diphosphatase [Candidatus Bipolaricaulota bacterium]|nr:NAD(+) diphosphatase [Candidatus Bipolaricaulota bacterium]